jgi:hypothetical protein
VYGRAGRLTPQRQAQEKRLDAEVEALKQQLVAQRKSHETARLEQQQLTDDWASKLDTKLGADKVGLGLYPIITS